MQNTSPRHLLRFTASPVAPRQQREEHRAVVDLVGKFRCKRPNVTSAASGGFDRRSMIALASSLILKLQARLWKVSRLIGT